MTEEFFEPPAPREDPEDEPVRYRQPPWHGPPQMTLPGVVPAERVLARSDKVAVCLTRLSAYPEGFAFDVEVIGDPMSDELDQVMFGSMHHRLRQEGGIPEDLLRIGVQFSDGTKATNTASWHHYGSKRPDGPILDSSGGGGGGGRWSYHQWVWPLPPAGPLTVVCEWPKLGIPLTRAELDAQLILDAAARAQVVYSEDDLPAWPSDDSDDDAGGPVLQIIR